MFRHRFAFEGNLNENFCCNLSVMFRHSVLITTRMYLIASDEVYFMFLLGRPILHLFFGLEGGASIRIL